MPLVRLRLSVLALAATSLACPALVPDAQDSDDGGAADSSSSEPAPPDLPPPGPQDIVVATFNVHRFFDTKCDSATCGNGAYEEVYSQAEFTYRADQLADAIDEMQADIVMLQEVESQACIDALVDRLPQFETAFIGETGFVASIDTAILSRLPLIEIRSHGKAPIPLPGGGSTHFARDYLEAHLDAGGRRLIAFVAHFKSKNDDDPDRRLAEANAARDLIDLAADNYPDALVLMGGDLNDVPQSEPLQAIEAGGGTVRVAEELGDDDWTYVYDGDTRAIDHLYLSTRSGGGSFVKGSARVLRGAGTDGWGGSDHAAVRGTFRVGG